MSEMKLKIHNKKCEVLAASIPGEETSLVYTAPYADGDFILLETDEDCRFCVIQMDDAMLPALVYTPGPRMAFHIPAPELRSCYSPKCFSGCCHLIRARAAKPEEISARRNLAFNPYDNARETGCFPHVISSVEAQGADFAARNAVDGIFENNSHGGWPYQAWGINKDSSAALKVDFGRHVTIDELRLTLRTDFPHDSWWTQGTVSFSDGTSEVVELGKRAEPQSFPIKRQGITWLKVGQLIKADDPSPFPALTQIEAFGRNSE